MSTKKRYLNTPLDDESLDRLDAFSKKYGITKLSVVKNALELYITQYEKQMKPLNEQMELNLDP